MHKEEGVGIFDGKKRAQDFHSDFGVCRLESVVSELNV
jgi:hypothetical protein